MILSHLCLPRLVGVVAVCLLAATGCSSRPRDTAPERQSGTTSAGAGAAPAAAAAQAAASPSAEPAARRSTQAAAKATAASRKSRPVRLAFVGDLALTMQVGRHLEARSKGEPVPDGVGPGFPFTRVMSRLQTADLLVGNLECVLSPLGQVSTDHNPFRCPDAALDALAQAGFGLVSVANNHALDYGRRAFRDMLRRLEQGRLPCFGESNLTAQPQAPHVVELSGLKIGLLTYYVLPRKPYSEIAAARSQVDVLVIYPHWGLEDQPRPLPLQTQLARDFIDAGADLVVGTHAHVLQPCEWYRGKLIAYGLGNFVFNGMNDTEAHSIGALLEADIAPDGSLQHRLHKIRIAADGTPGFIEPPRDASIIQPPP